MSDNLSSPPVSAPATGFLTVRAAAYVAQMLVTLILAYLIRQHLLSEELANTIKSSPDLQTGVQLLADAIALGGLAISGWVTKHFIAVSGEIAKKKLDIIGTHQTALVNAAAGTPAPPETTSNLNIRTEKEA